MRLREQLGSAGALLATLLAVGCSGTSVPQARPVEVAGVAKEVGQIVPNVDRPGETAKSSSADNRTVVTLKVTPEGTNLTADDPGLQLLLTGHVPEATPKDLTSTARWSVEPASLASLEPGGFLRPRAAGIVTVKATSGELEASTTLTIEPRKERPWSFARDIMPLFSRLGCNTGSCHGKADGQNGFHLSIFGYDSAGDYGSLVRDAGQRRISRLDPAQSLLLLKATGRAPHGGGPRIKYGAPEYMTLLEWIAAGAPELRGKDHGPLLRVSIDPPSVRLEEPGRQQIRVVAHYSDGHLRDVTRLAIFKVNDDSVASVTQEGLISLLGRAETDLVVRYQSHVASARIGTVINPDLKFDFAGLPRRNFIDEKLFKRLAALKVPPSPPASDAAFLRRISLDLTGEQPNPEEIRRFLAEVDTRKRARLVDQLLARDEFVLFWRIKLGDLLQISSARQGNGAYRYQEWLDGCLTRNTPWDEMVRTLLTALGDPNDREHGGPVNYALDALAPNEQAEQTAQRFLGLRMRCAQCHDHPFDVWTQDDYFGLAAFFAKIQRGGNGPMMGRPLVTINPAGQVVHLRTKKPAQAKQLDGTVVKVADREDPRRELARWMTDPENPYFARAMVNWVWAQLFGKGLVDPPDDMSRANPPVHPELLDALARHFVEHRYDIRDLIRTITNSEAFGLSSAPVPGNERDSRLFSHHTPRPLTAHQMADALAQATDVPNRYPSGDPTRRAIRVPDPSVASTILDTFGRCNRTTTCAAVQTPPLSLRQTLLLIGGDVIEGKVSNLGGYLASALKLELEPEELVENLYFRTLCRPPTAEELSRWSAELKQATSRQEAAEDLFWALLNSREFAFNH